MLPFQYFEIGSFLLSLLLFHRLRRGSFGWFVPYLGIVVFVDVLANYLPLLHHGSNQWRFNLYLPIQNLFFSYLFARQFVSPYHKKLVWYIVTGFWIVYIASLTFIQGFWTFNTYAFIYTCIEMILLANLYYLQAIKSESTQSIFRDPMFYVGSSCLVFFTAFAVFFAVYFYYSDSNEAYREHRFLYEFIGTYVNSIHYALLMLALLVYRPLRHV